MEQSVINTQKEQFSQNDIKDMIACYVEAHRIPKRVKIITDTTDFYRVDYDDVVILDDRPYLIRNNKREGRFGVIDQPKFWVKSAIDLITGAPKIIKLAHQEKFTSRVGGLTFHCFRSPKKEARVLSLVGDHPHFMHGFSTQDSSGNFVRIIEHIPGRTLADHVTDLCKSHEDYFYNHFPLLLDNFIDLVKAIKFLHDHGEKHGDIRRDHIIKDKVNGFYRWIDFDFNFMHRESMFSYDLFGLGNILIFISGGRDVTVQELEKNNPSLFRRLTHDDLNIVFRNRVVNLKKIFPYIPASLNFILLHFSAGAFLFYKNTLQMINDLMEVREDL